MNYCIDHYTSDGSDTRNDVQAMTLKTALIVEEDDKDSDMARMSILKRGTECKYQDGMMMANAQLGTDTFESLEPINNRDEESASRKSTMKKKGETIEPANEATTIESAMEEISVEGGENEGMEWKVSENMPIYLCGKAADSTNEECVFALCGNCYIPPTVHKRGGGRKRKRGVIPVRKDCCNHDDMGTLGTFDAPSFFSAKFRMNQAKHFPTKCTMCEVGFRERLSNKELEVRRT